MKLDNNPKELFWQETALFWILLSISISLLCAIYFDGLINLLNNWNSREEYGHGYLIPAISIFFIWQRKNILQKQEFIGNWSGIFILAIGLFTFFLGELSSLYSIIQYSFLISLYGITLSLVGWKSFKIIFIPLSILFFMIPIPAFIFNTLSSQLQLISSQIGVAFIRMFDISVYLEGNVIDLGAMKLQVVEACSGLNYLFPLMTLGFISAYFFNGELWKKAIIFLSTIPVTVLMNSFRIGAIGVTVEYWGQDMAEGVLHDFEGYVVFMACIGILIIEMWILSRIGKNRMSLREAFGLEFPEPIPNEVQTTKRDIPRSFVVSIVVLAATVLASYTLPEREEIIPTRKDFAYFPGVFKGWEGRKEYMEVEYIEALKFTDYIMMNYTDQTGGTVNFYSAYYASQRKGASAHSPRSCIPGGGWRITSLEEYQIPDVMLGGLALKVNRLLISKDGTKQLVYYWFQQRGRIVTNEYMMKWYLFWDAMTKHRTDGALIRLTTVLPAGYDIELADERLSDFVKQIAPIIPDYVAD